MEDTLLSVLENRPEACEVIVVLDEPYDDPYHLEGEVCFLPPGEGRSLAAAVNRGWRVATAPVIQVLTCGSRVGPGWVEAALPHFADRRIACVVPLVVDQRSPDRILAAGTGYDPAGRLVRFQQGVPADSVHLAHRTQVLPHASTAAFRRDVLEAAGGVDPGVGNQWALIDLVLILQRAGLLSILEPNCRVESSALVGAADGYYRLVREEEAFFWRWNAVSGSWRHVLRHVGSVAGDSLVSVVSRQFVPKLSGRLAGMRQPSAGEFLAHRIHRLRKAQSVEPKEALAPPRLIARAG